MKRVLLLAAGILLVLVVALGSLILVAFSGRRAVVDGFELSGLRIVEDGIVAIGVIPAGPGQVVLVDAGNDTGGTAILAELSRRRLGPEAVAAIFLTHGHADHTGAARLFPQAQILALADEVALVEGRAGARGPLLRLMPVSPTGIAVTRALTDGEQVRVGDASVRVFAVPGHTAGSAAYLVNGVLFVGDSADIDSGGGLQGAPWIFSDSQPQNQASLVALARRLAREQMTVTAIAPAHSGVATDGLAPLEAFARTHPDVGEAADLAAPRFELDPAWPGIPNGWVFGEVSSVAVDAQDHVWILQRPNRVPAAERASAAPPVLEYDASGQFLQAWGGPGAGYEWPETEHGIFVDHNGFVWIGGNGGRDDFLLKFTRDGTFVMQIGRSGQSGGNADTANLYRPADTYVHPGTNELFVADGYGNRRIIVFDAGTGAFKRMWGAFGNVPDGPIPSPDRPEVAPPATPVTETERGPGSDQFDLVHGVRVSSDGLVYVSDRANRRLQVFTMDGKFVTQAFISRECAAPACGNGHTAAGVAFSPDPEQRFLYVADRSPGRVVILERRTLRVLGDFGRAGTGPGEFNVLHHLATDASGNVYATEVNPGRRIQKFLIQAP